MSFVLSSDEFLVAEGSQLYLAVLRQGDASLQERVNISTSSQTAKAGIDFEGINKLLIFEKGQRQKDVRILIYPDNELEFEEIFRVQLLQVSQNPNLPTGDGVLGKPNIAVVKILNVEPLI